MVVKRIFFAIAFFLFLNLMIAIHPKQSLAAVNVQCNNPSVTISCPDSSYSCDYNTYMQYHCVQTGSGGTGGATTGGDNNGASPTSTISTNGSTTPTPKPLNSLCQYSTECESGFCDTRGVAYNADTGTQYGYCHVLPTPTNTPTPTTAVNCSSNSEVGMANTCPCTSSSSCASGYCDPNSHKCATDPTCKSNGIKSYTYDKSGCFDSRTAKSISVVCNDGTTKVIPSSFQCTDTWRLNSSAVSFCSTHKTCPTPTATNTPTPTPVCKTGTDTVSMHVDCGSGSFRYAQFSCYDGSINFTGSETSCKTPAQWKTYADSQCGNKTSCSPTITPATTTCADTGLKAIAYPLEIADCPAGSYKRALVVCNDGVSTTFAQTTCTSQENWPMQSAYTFCSTHKSCTGTPAPVCDPDPTGASANKLDMADFVVWKTDFLDTGDTVKRSACLKPDSKIDLLDFQVWKNKSYGLL